MKNYFLKKSHEYEKKLCICDRMLTGIFDVVWWVHWSRSSEVHWYVISSELSGDHITLHYWYLAWWYVLIILIITPGQSLMSHDIFSGFWNQIIFVCYVSVVFYSVLEHPFLLSACFHHVFIFWQLFVCLICSKMQSVWKNKM